MVGKKNINGEMKKKNINKLAPRQVPVGNQVQE
jgi:hypothetical protein